MQISHLPDFDYSAWTPLNYSEDWREIVVPLLAARRICLMEELARTLDPQKATALRGRIAELGDVMNLPQQAEKQDAALLADGDTDGRGWTG